MISTQGVREPFAGSARYQVKARLGDGGGGVVYRAFDRVEQREVALKVMRESDTEACIGFRDTFSTLRQLRHPNLVTLYDLTEERGRLLLAMELVEGIDLLEHVRRDGEFDEHRLRDAFSQLALALRAMHREGKVHRDIKPSNVRVTPEGRVVVLDLDLAVDIDADPHTLGGDSDARPVGTAAYMAPEQAASKEPRASCDWYSLGVVLYEALTGTLPYRGSDLEVLLAKQDGKPPPPSSFAAHVPRDLESLCVALLVPNPEERPSGAHILRKLGVGEDARSSRVSLSSMLTGAQPFLGREVELERLRGLVERSRGQAVVVRVTGEIGVGKTALCEEFIRRLCHDVHGIQVVTSACPRYPDRPHAPIHEPIARVTDSLRRGRSVVKLPVSASSLRLLERAFPDSVHGVEARQAGRSMPAPDPIEQRFRAIAALRALIGEAAEHAPLVLWIDNYHWADVDTQRLVTSLVFGHDAPRIMLLLSEEPGSSSAQSMEPAAHEVIALPRLGAMESRALAEALLERATGSTSGGDRVLYRDGLPLMIHERVRQALFFGEHPSEHAGLSQLIMRRVDKLAPPARRVLEIVCAAHDPVAQDVCERASELSRVEFIRQVSALRVGGLVRSLSQGCEDMLAPGHPVIADAVDLALQGAARVAIHGRLALALVARDPARASGRLLRHQGESGEHAAAALSARVAAEKAHEALAFQRAAELFTLCASLDPPGEDEAGYHLLRRMADALAHAGWALQAATIYRQAAAGAKAADALHMRQRAAEHFLRGAEVEEGIKAVSELLNCINMRLPKTPNRALLSIVARRTLLGLRGLGFREVEEGQVSARDLRRVDVLWASGMQLGLVDIMRGTDFMARGLAAALKTGEPHRIARALCTEAWAAVGIESPDLTRTHAILDTARELVERLDSPFLDGHLRLAHGMVAFGSYRLPECGAHCRDAERVFRDNCADAVWEVTQAQIHQTIALAQMARYEELGSKLELSLREARERGDVWGASTFMSIGAMSTKLAADLPDEATDNVHEAMQRWEGSGDLHFQQLFGLFATTYINLYRQAESALDQLDAMWPLLRRKMFLRVRFARMSLHELRARSCLVSGRRRGDGALLRRAEADSLLLLREHTPVASGFGHLIQASLHQERRHAERAIESLRLGIPYLSSQGLELWATPAQHALGKLLGGDEGRRLVEAAEQIFQVRHIKSPEIFCAMMLPGFAPR